jgi:hypothetical protein
MIRDAAMLAIGAGLGWCAAFVLYRTFSAHPADDVMQQVQDASPPIPTTGAPLRCICAGRRERNWCNCAMNGERNPLVVREANIAEAVRTGTPCRPFIGLDGRRTCSACGRGPCVGADRVR